MNDSDIGYASARTLARLYRAKEISPVEVVQAIYRHIEASEPHLNAMARVTVDRAMARFAYCQSIHEFFEGWDFLLTPAVSVPAFAAD
jgi:Asp-tRNA(Asn)/Glu-tRNA(Gln) amidotransferase A subunit family amidase